MAIEFRKYVPDRDGDDAIRIFAEAGWLDPTDADRCRTVKERFEHSNGYVAQVDGVVECIVHCAEGTMQYADTELSYSAVTNVATGLGGRKQGLASRLTALALADEAERGLAVSGLGVFETGFYDRLGYGTGSYDHLVSFDPVQLMVPAPARPPKRIPPSDPDAVFAARLARRKEHGWVTLTHPAQSHADMYFLKRSFGLGFYDGANGALSHFVWLAPVEQEHGPYLVHFMAYRTMEEFVELLSMLKSLGDQVSGVRLAEPASIQMQDLLRQPFRHERNTHGGAFATGIESRAFWQARILNIETCIQAVHIEGPAVQFNLVLNDPIEGLLDAGHAWRGLSGTYVVSLGSESEVHPGENATLPTLNASVGAFSRMWLGVRPATGLAVTESLSGPAELLQRLDHALRLPIPKRDWLF